MDDDLPLVPTSCLQSIVLRGFLREIPRNVRYGLWALPEHLVEQSLHAALLMYCTGDAPALPPQDVFAAMRYSVIPAFDLLCDDNEDVPEPVRDVLRGVTPDQFCAMLSHLVLAHSSRPSFESIAVSTSALGSPRAVELLHTALKGAVASRALRCLRFRGSSGSSRPRRAALLQSLAIDLEGSTLNRLGLHGLVLGSDDVLEKLVSVCGSKLECLDLTMSDVTGTSLLAALNTSGSGQLAPVDLRSSLKVLSLAETSVTSEDLLCLMNMQNLENLSLAGTDAVSPKSSLAVRDTFALAEESAILGAVLGASSLPRLKKLDLSESTVDLAVVLRDIVSVTDLTIARSRLSNPGEQMLVGKRLPPYLQVLDMTGVTGMFNASAFFQAASHRVGRSLTKLIFDRSSIFGWNDGDNEVVVLMGDGSVYDALHLGFSGLCELDLSSVEDLADETMSALLTCLSLTRRLEVLRLRNTTCLTLAVDVVAGVSFTDTGIAFPRLRVLDISHCKFGNTGRVCGEPELIILLDYFLEESKVETFIGAGLRYLTYQGLSHVFTRCMKTLKYVDVSRMESTAGIHASWIIDDNVALGSLRTLIMTACGRIPLWFEKFLRKVAPNLEAFETGQKHRSAPIGRAVRRAELATELVQKAHEEESSLIAELPWRSQSKLM